MKKMKWNVLMLALATMLGFTSCLDGEDNSNILSYNEIVKVDNLTGLYVSQLGYKVAPLNSEDLKDVPMSSGYIQLFYSYDYTQDMSGGKIDATILGYSPINEGIWMPQAPGEADANAPVMAVNTSYDNSLYYFYKLNDLFLPLSFFVRKDADMNDMKEREAEIATHQFTLYYTDEDFSAEGMTLNLRHKLLNVAEDDKFTQSSGAWMHFNINDALNRYGEIYSKRPDKITVSYEQNARDNSYAEDSVSVRTVELNYESIMEAHDQISGNK